MTFAQRFDCIPQTETKLEAKHIFWLKSGAVASILGEIFLCKHFVDLLLFKRTTYGY